MGLLGVYIAQNIAKRYRDQVKKIVLMNTFYSLTKLPEMVFELVGDFHRMNLPLVYRVRSVLPWVYSEKFLSQPNQIENLINFAEQNPHPQSLVGYERQLEALKLFESRSWLHEIKLPTLIIAGEEDIIAPVAGAKEVQNRIGNHAQMTVIPGGHASPIEQPLEVVNAILGFID